MKSVLFVCTGNTCRSPMAEALFRVRLAALRLPETVTVSSAGLAAPQGSPATAEAVTALSERGIDARHHRARQLTPDLLAGADLILTMTAAHKRAILQAVPEAGPRLFTLQEFAGRGWRDVADPVGYPLEVYRLTRDELEEAIGAAVLRLPEFFGWAEEGGARGEDRDRL